MVLVDTAPSISTIFSFGVFVVGMASWLGGGDDSETGESGDDEFAVEDDDFGMDDFDDDFGGMEEMGDSGGTSSTELENRIEDLESEIANVSSTANTVRSENEQISEKVDDVEENVRKLLEIYEMVTRGVNPFVDDVSTGAGMDADAGSFGLFDSDDEDAGDQSDEDLDSDIADAEAEDFFDDDAFDDFDDEFDDGEDEFDDFTADDELEGMEEFDETDGMEDMMDEGMDDGIESMDDNSDDSGGGTSFEELKAEYESGEADWADELDDGESSEDTMDEDLVGEDDADDEPGDLFIEDDLIGEDDDFDEDAGVDTSESDEAIDGEPFEVEEEASPDEATSAEPVAADGNTERETSASEFQFGAAHVAAGEESPYLERPPNGYLADVVILEWLDYLVDAYDARNAVRAINYYERIGWIGEPMRDHCVEVLLGITDAEYLYRDEFGTTDITMQDHRKSLGYVEELAGGQLDRTFVERLDTLGTNGV